MANSCLSGARTGFLLVCLMTCMVICKALAPPTAAQHRRASLLEAITAADADTVAKLLDRRDSKRFLTSTYGSDLLRIALGVNNNQAIIKLLLKKGISTESVDPITGETPLFAAVEAQNRDYVEILLSAGANTNYQ